MTNEEIIRLVLEIGGQQGLKDLAKDAGVAAEKLEDTGKAAQKTGDDAAKAGRSFLEAGRFLQDFSQGGVGGVLNNLEGIGRSLKDIPLNVGGLVAALSATSSSRQPRRRVIIGWPRS